MDRIIKLKHPIDLRIDYAFKVLFATKGNEPILVDFLNVFLKPKIPIKSVILLNPYNDKEFESDKLSVVDVKAEDQNGHIYQIEMQIGNKPHLRYRMLFTWSQVYTKQIKTGESVGQLNPVISIWLLTQNLLPDDRFHHIVETRYRHNRKLFIDHMEIHLLELSKWQPPKRFTRKHLWAYLFNGPHDRFELPLLFNIPIMRRVMAELREISEKEIKWHRYLSRKLYLHDLATEKEAEEQRAKAQIENEKALLKTQKALKQTEKALNQTEKTLNQTEKALNQTEKTLDHTEKTLHQTEKALQKSEKKQAESELQLKHAAQREAELLEKIAQLEATKNL